MINRTIRSYANVSYNSIAFVLQWGHFVSLFRSCIFGLWHLLFYVAFQFSLDFICEKWRNWKEHTNQFVSSSIYHLSSKDFHERFSDIFLQLYANLWRCKSVRNPIYEKQRHRNSNECQITSCTVFQMNTIQITTIGWTALKLLI